MKESKNQQSEPSTSYKRPKRRIHGVVVSKSGDKTISVELVGRTVHPVYGRTMRTKTRFLVHDEMNKANIGEEVAIEECRPLSRRKHWRLVEQTSAHKD